MLYQDRRFSKHPHFRYFALNTEVRHQAQEGLCLSEPSRQSLSVDELREMITPGIEGRSLTNRMLHFLSPCNKIHGCLYHEYTECQGLLVTV